MTFTFRLVLAADTFWFGFSLCRAIAVSSQGRRAAGQDPVGVRLEDVRLWLWWAQGWWPWPALPLTAASITEVSACPRQRDVTGSFLLRSPTDRLSCCLHQRKCLGNSCPDVLGVFKVGVRPRNDNTTLVRLSSVPMRPHYRYS